MPEHFEKFSYVLTDGYTKETYDVETFDEYEHYYGFARGNLLKLKAVFGPYFDFVDERVSVPLKYPLKFTGKLKDEQASTLREWISARYGMLQAPPRWGKTVWMTALVCKLRQRTLMLANQEDLCHQLEETIRQFTNINELEEEYGIKLCGVLDEWEDFFPVITLSTYQCFAVTPRGRKVIRQQKDAFGLVMVDEAHTSPTELYSDVISALNAAYRCGVTATPTRKDGKHVIVNDVLGPVVSKGKGEQLHVEWSWEATGTHVPEFSNWGTMWNRLYKKKSRNRKIARKVVEDVEAGHFVLVTTERLEHIGMLREAITGIDSDITVGELSGRTKNREKFRSDAKVGEYQVVIAISKMVQLGYNVPRWSCFHNTLPMANKENWYQRISRIRTPMEPAFKGDDYVKPQPVARIWVDYGHKAIWGYRGIVKRVNDGLKFTCLNPEKKVKRRRKGVVTFVEIKDD